MTAPTRPARMAELTIVRVVYGAKRTYGVFIDDDGDAFALTLEREWDNGSNRKSVEGGAPGACIPEGTYVCVRVQSPRHGDTFEVTGVPNRSHILLHKGNLEDDSRGCILVGDCFDPVGGEDGMTESRNGFEEFLAKVSGLDRFRLSIKTRVHVPAPHAAP